jgi:hypothetical protein
MLHSEYYTIFQISLTSFIPVLYGIIFSFIYTDNNKSLNHIFGVSVRGRQITINLMRMIYIFILSFLTLLLAIRLIRPVPSEGWLRSLFIMIMFSGESLVVYYILKLTFSRLSNLVLIILVLIFFAAMPFGFVLHNPWNYPMFFSPFYWLGWAWIIQSAGESLAYASIGIATTALYVLAARFSLRKKRAL